MVALVSTFAFAAKPFLLAEPNSSGSTSLIPRLTPPRLLNSRRTTYQSALPISSSLVDSSDTFVSRFGSDKPRSGADILVEALERHGVRWVFAYPGGASMDIHRALSGSTLIQSVLPRHEYGGVFAAEGYARSSGKPGVCIVTSGPGATNLVTGLADAMLDSVPLIAITGQVARNLMGTDAFQEVPTVAIGRSVTKHSYLVMGVDQIPRIIDEAFYLATSGRPGPVLVDMPEDIQKQLSVPNWNQPMRLPHNVSKRPKPPEEAHLRQIARLIAESQRPVLYVGGGCLNSSKELKKFVGLTGIPVASTLMGIGSFPFSDDLSLQMLGMYGTVYANYAVDKSDLLLAFGARFDDRVTRNVEAFGSHARIVHIDIDATELGKMKQPHVPVFGDVKLALQGMINLLENHGSELKLDFSNWREELNQQKRKFPLSYKMSDEAIPPQHVVQVLHEMTNGEAIISTGVGRHQMWAAQFYKFTRPRQFLTSGGLGAMGFGLPAAIGAAIANPDALVVDIDGDGSFLMSIQELATLYTQNLPVKILILNNQNLGMVREWEDEFTPGKKDHSYLGDPWNVYDIYPNMLKFAEACGIPAARVTCKDELREAIRTMIRTPGPHLLDVIVSSQDHVLPKIPSGGAFKDIITE